MSNELKSNDSKEENVSLIAFSTSVKSTNGPSDCDSFVLVEISDASLQGILGEEINFQEAYNQLLNNLN